MFKQLYTRKISKIPSFLAFGIICLFLSSCSEETDDNQATVAELPAAIVEAAAEVQQETDQVSDDVEETVSDEGFLNRDMILGDVNAPVEIIEYASLTCNHCAVFHNQVLPQLKKEYVDTGKAKIVFRSFLLNGIDAKLSQLTRCVSEKRYVPFMNVLFGRQENWLNFDEQARLVSLYGQEAANEKFFDYIVNEVEKIAAQVGLNKSKIEACYNNPEVGKYIFAVQQEGAQKYKINATPTIIVNGEKTNGNSFEAVKDAIEDALD